MKIIESMIDTAGSYSAMKWKIKDVLEIRLWASMVPYTDCNYMRLKLRKLMSNA